MEVRPLLARHSNWKTRHYERNVMVSIETNPIDTSTHSETSTSEFAWRQSFYLMGLTELSLGTPSLAVVLAPHPADESLGLGGTMSTLLSRGTTVIVVTATDGPHSRSSDLSFAENASRSRRSNETRAAMYTLGEEQSGNVLNVQLHLPFGNLAGVEMELEEHIGRFLGPNDVCFSTWELDGHPDREAAGRAARRASLDAGARHFQFPIDMWSWASVDDPTLPWRKAHRVSLEADDIARKNRAIGCYGSEQLALVDGIEHSEVMPSNVLAHFQRSFEAIFN
jgi:LmbE family N-acetylglucosaminyl deacetylase